jgi:hypothetical protein
MKKRWFVHNGEEIEFFDSESAARDAARDAIELWREIGIRDNGEEWPDEVDDVMWGRIEQGAKLCNGDYVLTDVK